MQSQTALAKKRIPMETAPQGKERISATARFVIRKPSDRRKREKNERRREMEVEETERGTFEYFLRNPIYRMA